MLQFALTRPPPLDTCQFEGRQRELAGLPTVLGQSIVDQMDHGDDWVMSKHEEHDSSEWPDS